MTTDLFGVNVGPQIAGKSKRLKLTGHAGTPGTGPAGETCKSCANLVRIKYHGRPYRKCGLMRNAWTHGPGSDIRARDPACHRWEPEDGQQRTVDAG
jgi:hypothetical protein